MIHSRISIALLVGTVSALSGTARSASGQDQSATAEEVVRELYDLVTFDTGTTPDWDEVRSLFVPEAIVVLRTSRENSTVFSLDGFVQDFADFIESENVERSGFVERVVRLKPMVFGDIAHVLVLYEANIPGRERPPTRGVDSFQLIKKDSEWKIVSVTNELPTPDLPVPAELAEVP